MTGKDALKACLLSTQQMVGMYLSDLSDDDLRLRPAPGANHIAWQIGHVTAAEKHFIKEVVPDAAYPDLPAAFLERHGPKKGPDDSPAGLCTKAEYLDHFNKVRMATIAALDKLSDADLDRPNTGMMGKFAPRLGDLFVLLANHTMMHAGQFTVVRRKLGKPVLF
jgi:uncharacterized damage-inducible protein DinB